MTAMTVKRTRRFAYGMLYEVLVNGITVWSQSVVFGRERAFRAGGEAFVEAAREQEKIAARY